MRREGKAVPHRRRRDSLSNQGEISGREDGKKIKSPKRITKKVKKKTNNHVPRRNSEKKTLADVQGKSYWVLRQVLSRGGHRKKEKKFSPYMPLGGGNEAVLIREGGKTGVD